MGEENGSRGLRNLGAYFIKALKFYDVKNEKLSRAVFFLILLISFVPVFFPGELPLRILTGVVGVTLTYLASTVYLMAFIRDLRGIDYSVGSCFYSVAFKTPTILLSSVMYLAAVAITLGMDLIADMTQLSGVVMLFLIILFFILYLMYHFNVCYIVDRDFGIAASYKASRLITAGRKRSLLARILAFNFIVGIPSSLFMTAAMSSGNVLVTAFIISFSAAIINLMQQRLTALMYMDLEYGPEAFHL